MQGLQDCECVTVAYCNAVKSLLVKDVLFFPFLCFKGDTIFRGVLSYKSCYLLFSFSYLCSEHISGPSEEFTIEVFTLNMELA